MRRALTARPRPSKHRKDSITSSFINECYLQIDRDLDFAHVARNPLGPVLAVPKKDLPPEPRVACRETVVTRSLRAQIDLKNWFIAQRGGSRTIIGAQETPVRLPDIAPEVDLFPNPYPEPAPLRAESRGKRLADAQVSVAQLEAVLASARARLLALEKSC